MQSNGVGYMLEKMSAQWERGVHDSKDLETAAWDVRADDCMYVLHWIQRACEENQARSPLLCVQHGFRPLLGATSAREFADFFTEVGDFLNVLEFCAGTDSVQDRLFERERRHGHHVSVSKSHSLQTSTVYVTLEQDRWVREVNRTNYVLMTLLSKRATYLPSSQTRDFLFEPPERMLWSPTTWYAFSIERYPPPIRSAACHKMQLIIDHFGRQHPGTNVRTSFPPVESACPTKMLRSMEKIGVKFSLRLKSSFFLNYTRTHARTALFHTSKH
jgi:hypothetical protein